MNMNSFKLTVTRITFIQPPRILLCGINQFHTTHRLEHDPNLKKKKKSTQDQAKEKIRRDRQDAKRRAEPILIPTDPDTVPGKGSFLLS